MKIAVRRKTREGALLPKMAATRLRRIDDRASVRLSDPYRERGVYRSLLGWCGGLKIAAA
jgi:hypothetical protein